MCFAINLLMEKIQHIRKILIVDSGKNKLFEILQQQGAYNITLSKPDNVITEIIKEKPNLVIGDFYQKNQADQIIKIRENNAIHHIPIILCTNKKNITSLIKKVNGNVNDYIVAPYKKTEVSARIERVIERHEKVLNFNPLSHLPGNISIKEFIEKLNRENKSYSLLYLDLDNFKAYNDFYGYSKGDEVLKFVADLNRNEINTSSPNNPLNFIGHIGGDDFVVIRPIEEIDEFCQNFIKNFDEKIKTFYNEKDCKNGFITSFNRNGKLQKFPIMTVSLAVIIKDPSVKMHYGELSLRGAEIKKYLKSLNGSNYLIDRRQIRQLRRDSISAPIKTASRAFSC